MRLIPLAHNSKKPLAGEDWHVRISEDSAQHAKWLSDGLNVGFAVEENGRSVVDFDDKEAAHQFRKSHSDICTVVVETRRGMHFHFSGRTTTRKFPHGDVKGNGYVVFPPSVVDGFAYRLIADGPLQAFPEHLFPPVQATRDGVQVVTRGVVKDVDAYLARIESISGKNGSAGLVRAAAVCRDAGDSEAEALLRLIAWNKLPVVSPPWTDKELARAVTRVFKK